MPSQPSAQSSHNQRPTISPYTTPNMKRKYRHNTTIKSNSLADRLGPPVDPYTGIPLSQSGGSRGAGASSGQMKSRGNGKKETKPSTGLSGGVTSGVSKLMMDTGLKPNKEGKKPLNPSTYMQVDTPAPAVANIPITAAAAAAAAAIPAAVLPTTNPSHPKSSTDSPAVRGAAAAASALTFSGVLPENAPAGNGLAAGSSFAGNAAASEIHTAGLGWGLGENDVGMGLEAGMGMGMDAHGDESGSGIGIRNGHMNEAMTNNGLNGQDDDEITQLLHNLQRTAPLITVWDADLQESFFAADTNTPTVDETAVTASASGSFSQPQVQQEQEDPALVNVGQQDLHANTPPAATQINVPGPKAIFYEMAEQEWTLVISGNPRNRRYTQQEMQLLREAFQDTLYEVETYDINTIRVIAAIGEAEQ